MLIYKTIQGDVWDLISWNVYQDEGFIDYLINANPSRRETVVFNSGVELNIPAKPMPSPVTKLPPWKRG